MRANGCLCFYPYCGELTVKIQGAVELLFQDLIQESTEAGLNGFVFLVHLVFYYV